jgi:hypothetical protein
VSSPAKAGDPVTPDAAEYWVPRFHQKPALAGFGIYRSAKSETSDFAGNDNAEFVGKGYHPVHLRRRVAATTRLYIRMRNGQ